MSSGSNSHDRDHLQSAFLYALQALPENERSAFEAHLATCFECRNEMATLRSTIDSFVAWPTDVLRPTTSLWDRISRRISNETGLDRVSSSPRQQAKEPDWEEVTEGLSCKVLSIDAQRDRVTMLVRLAPGTDYPAHRHADVEELHLLDGELWIDDKKLKAGDYVRAEAVSVDHRVWSETGCTCFLLTSLKDELL